MAQHKVNAMKEEYIGKDIKGGKYGHIFICIFGPLFAVVSCRSASLL